MRYGISYNLSLKNKKNMLANGFLKLISVMEFSSK